jgi:SnoaL-like domain
MSQQNVDVVRASFEAFRRRDLDAFLSCFDPEVEYRSLVLEVEGTYHGHEGMRSWCHFPIREGHRRAPGRAEAAPGVSPRVDTGSSLEAWFRLRAGSRRSAFPPRRRSGR